MKNTIHEQQTGAAAGTVPTIITSLDYSQLMPAEHQPQLSLIGLPKNDIGKELQLTFAVEEYRASLARSAIMNIAALSVLESRFAEIEPNAAPRLKAIVDAAAWSTAIKIAKL